MFEHDIFCVIKKTSYYFQRRLCENNGIERKLEFTEYIDGKQINDDMKKLMIEHITEFKIQDCHAAEDKYLEMFENLVKKKQSKC